MSLTHFKNDLNNLTNISNINDSVEEWNSNPLPSFLPFYILHFAIFSLFIPTRQSLYLNFACSVLHLEFKPNL